MLLKLLQILSIILAFLSAVALMFPWSVIARKWQLRHNNREMRSALRMVDKMDRKLDEYAHSPDGLHYYNIQRLWGGIAGQKVSAEAYDRMHHLLRRSHGLPQYSLQSPEGILNRGRISKSFSDIEARLQSYLQTDTDVRLRKIAFLTLFFSAAFSILVAINT